mmetsp:Transcript_76012/g.203967  ORF Transcript_76012/g.203967 Transcript_76012/m.203967 type:complete len:258 (-) Transcript_76012:103-876(-)
MEYHGGTCIQERPQLRRFLPRRHLRRRLGPRAHVLQRAVAERPLPVRQLHQEPGVRTRPKPPAAPLADCAHASRAGHGRLHPRPHLPKEPRRSWASVPIAHGPVHARRRRAGPAGGGGGRLHAHGEAGCVRAVRRVGPPHGEPAEAGVRRPQVSHAPRGHKRLHLRGTSQRRHARLPRHPAAEPRLQPRLKHEPAPEHDGQGDETRYPSVSTSQRVLISSCTCQYSRSRSTLVYVCPCLFDLSMSMFTFFNVCLCSL